VPSRWRIRHKLLLGVALVVGVMALLVVGTLYGLWSYYVTTNSIRAKLQEEYAAEELKAAVAELASRETVLAFRDSPDHFRDAVRKVQARADRLRRATRGDPRTGP